MTEVILFFETHTNFMHSPQVTIFSFTAASSRINHSSATTLLPNSLSTRTSSSFHLSSQLTLFPLYFITAFNSPTCLDDCFNSSFNDPSLFPLYMAATDPPNALFLSINLFSFPIFVCCHFQFHLFLSENGNLFIS